MLLVNVLCQFLWLSQSLLLLFFARNNFLCGCETMEQLLLLLYVLCMRVPFIRIHSMWSVCALFYIREPNNSNNNGKISKSRTDSVFTSCPCTFVVVTCVRLFFFFPLFFLSRSFVCLNSVVGRWICHISLHWINGTAVSILHAGDCNIYFTSILASIIEPISANLSGF